MKNLQVRIKYSSKSKKYVTNLKAWLSKELEFSSVEGVVFEDNMVLAVTEFDKDNSIYVLIPKKIFEVQREKKRKRDFHWGMTTALDLSIKGSIGDSVGFNIGKRHFTLVKDTGYATEVTLKKLSKI